MVEEQIVRRGVSDPRVLAAIRDVPRERFVPQACRDAACDDSALPIEHGQTISQPYIVAYMTARLDVRDHHTVLEIGTGTGYQAAVLARLGARVVSIERIDALRTAAAARLAELGVTNVTVHGGDGTIGHPAEAPFDRIIVTAGAPAVPQALCNQLAEDGVLIAPIGDQREQIIVRLTKHRAQITETSLIRCRFVKLIGAQGWHCEQA
jgi:protein-L-isoaspartate(D-aspartate) O-methyltransferase